MGNASTRDSVSLSADGNTAIVGGYADNIFAGAAWIWTRSAGVWTQQGTKPVGSGAGGNAQQGFSVSLSAYRRYFIPDYRFGGLGFRLSRSL